MIISGILFIILVGITPFPTLPVIIFFYEKLNFIESFISLIISTIIITLCHYNLGKFLLNKRYNIFNLNKKLKVLSNKFNKLSTKDLFILRISTLNLSKIFNILAGYTLIPIKKVIAINIYMMFLWHFLYFYLAKNIDFVANTFQGLGLNITITKLISILTLSSIIYLILKTIKYFESSFKNKKKIK